MSNGYFDNLTQVSRFTLGRAATINAILAAIEAGFDKVPTQALLVEDRVTYAADTGAANAYAIALDTTLTSYTTGLSVRMLVANTNTGASTLNVDGVGARAIKRLDGTDPQAGDLTAGDIVELIYNNTQFILMGPYRANLQGIFTPGEITVSDASEAKMSFVNTSGDTTEITQNSQGFTIHVDPANNDGDNSSFRVYMQDQGEVLIANASLTNVAGDLVVEGSKNQSARVIVNSDGTTGQRFVRLTGDVADGGGDYRTLDILSPSVVLDASSPWRLTDFIEVAVNSDSAVNVFSAVNESSNAAAQVRIPLELGGDLGTGTAKGFVVFAADGTAGLVDNEARTLNFLTSAVAGGGASIRMSISPAGVINMASMPTSSAGLASGDLWNDSGTVKIV